MTKQERSWIFYDWANSAYTLVATSTILPIFFKSVVSKGIDNSISTAYWGYANTIATLFIVLLAPILGTIADYKGYKKRFFIFFVLLGVVFTTLFPLIKVGDMLTCLIFYVISYIGFAGANIFYDSFLVDVTDYDNYDKISSLGFGIGYIGSTIPLIISIIFIMKPSIIGLTGSNASIIATKISFIVTALWWFIFSIPMFKNVKQRHYINPEPNPIRKSFKRLFKTFKEIKKYKTVALFILAYFFYIDGVSTIIKMATVYGADIGLTKNTLIMVLLVIQFVAFPCSIIYGKLAKKFSAKFMILIGICIYTFITIFAYFITSAWQFLVIGILVGTSQGGIQSLSRSVYSKIIPKENATEFFGFYNILGKFSAAIGPFLIGFISQITGNSRTGILSIIVLFITGGIMLFRLDLKSKIC